MFVSDRPVLLTARILRTAAGSLADLGKVGAYVARGVIYLRMVRCAFALLRQLLYLPNSMCEFVGDLVVQRSSSAF
jgi:hypothetical protein